MRARFCLALAAGVALTAVTIVAPAAASKHARSQRASSASAPTARHDPEFSPLQPLASRIGLLGGSTYPSVYAGVQIEAGVLYIYTVRDHDAKFLAAVAAADSARLPYTVRYVTRSYAVQAATSRWLASTEEALHKQGIVPEWWGARPSADAVLVAFQKPTSGQLHALQNTLMRVREGDLAKRPLALPREIQVTEGSYPGVAAAVLNAEAPSADDIIAFSSLLNPGHPSDGYADNQPFYGADKIWYTVNNLNFCTSNFSFHGGSTPTNLYVVTAAHCSGEATGHDFYTCYTTSGGECNYNVGTVSSPVFYNYDDFELMRSSNYGYVWNDSNGSVWSVNGWIDAEPGDVVTTDAATSGATYDIYVLEGDGSTCATYGGHTVCHAMVLESGKSLCPPGDSGGPILERESDGYHIYAAGIILGYGSSMGSYFCYAQQVYWIQTAADLRVTLGN